MKHQSRGFPGILGFSSKSPKGRATRDLSPPPSRRAPRAAALLLPIVFLLVNSAVMYAGSTKSPRLFEDPSTPRRAVWERAAPIAPGASEVVRERTVRVRFDLMGPQTAGRWGAGKTPLESVELNLFPDVLVKAVLERVERDGPDGFTWVGRAEGSPESRVFLVFHKGVLAGSVMLGDKQYQIRYRDRGFHSIEEIDPHGTLGEGAEPLEARSNGEVLLGKSSPTGMDDGSVIDVGVVYTEAAKLAEGGTEAIEARIVLAATQSNDGYANSLVTQRINLVWISETDYSEVGFDWSAALNRLRATSDGYMDEVHEYRNWYRADLVSLIVSTSFSGTAGLAFILRPPMPAAGGFSVVSRTASTAQWSFAHELGHNMGCAHQRGGGTTAGAFFYSFGHSEYSAPPFRTVMATSASGVCTPPCPPRILYFSNPDVLYVGRPTGVGIDQPNSAHNALTMNNTALAVANFRRSVCNFVFDPPAASFEAAGGFGSVIVTASTQDCPWVASSDVEWIEVLSGFYVTGNGTVEYSVAENPGPDARTGSLTIAGQTYTVEQAAP